MFDLSFDQFIEIRLFSNIFLLLQSTRLTRLVSRHYLDNIDNKDNKDNIDK